MNEDLQAVDSLLNEEYLLDGTTVPTGVEDITAEALMPWLAGASVGSNVLMIVFFILKAWGLYNINKKLGEDHPWLAWIPVVQVYSFVKA